MATEQFPIAFDETTKLCYIGVDPGSGGGIAWLRSPGTGTIECCPMPGTMGDTLTALRALVAASHQVVAFVEDIPKFAGRDIPGSRIAVMFQNFGMVLGILAALNVRTIMITPQKWQKFYGLGTKKAAGGQVPWKNKLKAEAQRRHPHSEVTLSTADAILILEYGLSET
jgi:hypothetical protein